jgi:acyl-CoA synthetase (AMP-forming)/AMP-acid ligase II
MNTFRRRELAERILAQRPRVNGEMIDSADSRFRALSRRMLHSGVQPGEIVALRGLEGRDLVFAALAVWHADAIPAPEASPEPPESAARSSWVITDELAVVPTTGDRPAGDRLASTAVIHTTSGSTGRPKPTRRGVASVLIEAAGYRERLVLSSGDCVAVPIPLVHSLGWGVAFSALLSGCDIDTAPLVRATTLSRKIDASLISVVALTPPLARLLVDTRREGAGELRVGMVGAGRVTPDLDRSFEERFGCALLHGYGSTETGGTFLGERGMGTPIPGVEIVQPPRGREGELVLRFAAPVEGYLDGESPTSSEWKTGDTVRHETDGTVYFRERIRGLLRLNGRYVDSDVLEKVLCSVPGVAEVYLLALPRDETPEIEDFYGIVAGKADAADLIASMARHLPDTVPVPRIVTCDRLPRNSLGKPDRALMTEIVRERNEHAQPRRP